tara:strand:+ start:6074 stop:7024 length:951 start_codon:yes stop_codon:yes gene_type:complete
MEELLAKFFAGETSVSETKEVEEWRSASKDNARFFLEAKKIWLAGTTNEEPKPGVFDDIVKQQAPTMSLLPKILRFAAAIVIVAGVSFLLYNYFISPYGSGDEIVAEKTLSTKLPDGSNVTVQKGSRLKINDFETSRSVTLSGRAYFDIKEDASKPFTIETESAKVQVVGTKFVVNSRDKKNTEVFVESGQVNLYQKPEAFNGSNMMVSLTSGESGELSVGTRGIRKKKVKDQNYLAWKTGYLSFRNTNMTDVANILEDTYGIQVEFENASISLCRLTANYKEKTSEEVLEYIAETFDFSFTRQGNTVVFSGHGCR